MDFPFQAEYAKSGRASCKSCKSPISKDELRLAVMVQSPVFDGKIPNWFHFKCFWPRARKLTDAASEIKGFDTLRWEDQQRITKQVGSAGTGAGSAKASASTSKVTDDTYRDFKTEYAKSGKSQCRGCEDLIAKNEVRISRKEYESQKAKMYGPVDQWHHLNCFEEKRDELEFDKDMQPEKIPGFKSLKKEDQEALVEKLGKGSKKRKAKTDDSGIAAKKSKEDIEKDEALKSQSKLLWNFRDKLSALVSLSAVKLLLETNDQQPLKGENLILEQAADCMAFGALQPCPECKEGQLKYGQNSYHCTGNITEWTKCMYQTQQPKRKPFKISSEFHDVDFLKKYKYVKRDRVFSGGPIKAGFNLDTNLQPLSGMSFYIGKTEKKKPELKKSIEKLGGSLSTKIDGTLVACISTQAELDKMTKPMKNAQDAGVCVVTEVFLDSLSSGVDAVPLIKKHTISFWSSEPEKKIKKSGMAVKSTFQKKQEDKNEAFFTKSMPASLKLKLKGGAAVDPESGLENTAHVYTKGKKIYNAVLGMVDIVRGTNSFYKLQLLQSDGGNRFNLFRAWGRVGTTIGGSKIESCGGEARGLQMFCDLYREKTGNDFDTDPFVKIPNKFYPLDIDYEAPADEVKGFDKDAGSNSKLSKPVQDLVKMIFDIETMKKAMLEFEIDLKKMPLGKLSKKQIESAYKVLTELTQLVKTKGSASRFLDASNRFYTLIPHDFGMKAPPILDTDDAITAKTQMLDNLLEIEVAYNLLKTGEDSSVKDPIDTHYEKLKTDVKPLDRKSEDYQRILEYVKNTHASTHNYYDLEVLNIFEIDRKGESKRFKPFKALHNHKLLWHGSRVTNFVGILSQGLRIAPPEAPSTGYMFGKGVYFADMVSKSANYCATSSSAPTGLMMLCDIALGDMYELTHSEFVETLPKGKHSTKGIGKTFPNPDKAYVNPDGVEIPLGPGKNDSSISSSLLYNEYIVYDTAQINIKYLIKMDFKWKW